MRTAKESLDRVVKEAEAELAKGWAPPAAPTWHPYYWQGRLDAAREILKAEAARK
jgi:hypothetical protein